MKLSTKLNIMQFVHRKPHGAKLPLSIERLWRIECIVALLLLLLMLSFDIWIYQVLALGHAEISPDQLNGVTPLNKKAIIIATKTLKAHEDFLQNPTLSSVPNPF